METTIIKSKICTKCKELKELSEFAKEKTRKDGIRSDCKICNTKRVVKYQRTKEGLVTKMYANQRFNSKARGSKPPDFTKEELKEWLFNNDNYHRLHKAWEDSGYLPNLIPSCDRHSKDDSKYDYKPYSLDRLRVITWGENNSKYKQDSVNGINTKNCKPIVQMSMEGNFIKEYYSVSEASRQTGVSISNICSCARCIKRRSAGGFKWEHKT